jgi:transposase
VRRIPSPTRAAIPDTPAQGIADRFDDIAGQSNLEVDLALIDPYDQVIRELERRILDLAKQHDPETLKLLRSVPGIGPILSLVLLYEIHDINRFPGSRILPRIVASSNEPANPEASAMGHREAKLAMSI